MKKFIIFYASSKYFDSVVINAESLNVAYEDAQALSRVYSVTILGIFEQTYYLKLHPHE